MHMLVNICLFLSEEFIYYKSEIFIMENLKKKA